MALAEKVIRLIILRAEIGNAVRAEVQTLITDSVDEDVRVKKSYIVDLTAQERTQLQTFVSNLLLRANPKRTPEAL